MLFCSHNHFYFNRFWGLLFSSAVLVQSSDVVGEQD